MPFFDRRNPVLRDRPAEDVVHELEARAARRRLHANAADAELPVPAGLLLVLALGVGLAANRLAIGHLGRLERQVHVVALVQLGDDHLDVLLPRAGQQKFLGLRVARETQRRILFQNPVNRRADAVLVGARLGLDGERDGRLGNVRRRIMNRRGLVAQRVAGERVLQLWRWRPDPRRAARPPPSPSCLASPARAAGVRSCRA